MPPNRTLRIAHQRQLLDDNTGMPSTSQQPCAVTVCHKYPWPAVSCCSSRLSYKEVLQAKTPPASWCVIRIIRHRYNKAIIATNFRHRVGSQERGSTTSSQTTPCSPRYSLPGTLWPLLRSYTCNRLFSGYLFPCKEKLVLMNFPA